MLKVLRCYGGNMNIQNMKALRLAIQFNNKKCIDYLRSSNFMPNNTNSS